jgi:hypothetical protein
VLKLVSVGATPKWTLALVFASTESAPPLEKKYVMSPLAQRELVPLVWTAPRGN